MAITSIVIPSVLSVAVGGTVNISLLQSIRCYDSSAINWLLNPDGLVPCPFSTFRWGSGNNGIATVTSTDGVNAVIHGISTGTISINCWDTVTGTASNLCTVTVGTLIPTCPAGQQYDPFSVPPCVPISTVTNIQNPSTVCGAGRHKDCSAAKICECISGDGPDVNCGNLGDSCGGGTSTQPQQPQQPAGTQQPQQPAGTQTTPTCTTNQHIDTTTNKCICDDGYIDLSFLKLGCQKKTNVYLGAGIGFFVLVLLTR